MSNPPLKILGPVPALREVPEDPAASELAKLRASMHDMVTLLALPAIWSGRSPTSILSSAVEMLSSLARLDLVYARLTPKEGQSEESVFLNGSVASDPKLIAAVREGTGSLLANPGIGFCDLPDTGRIHLLVAELGFYGGTGMIGFGARRAAFPDRAESLLLRTAANLLATAIQGARLVDEAQSARARASFLAEVSEALSSSPQRAEALIEAAAKSAVGSVAQVCAVDLWQASTKSVSTAAIAHRDTWRLEEARERQDSPAVRETVARVIRGGGALLHGTARGTTPERLAAIAPIIAAGVVIGAVSLFPDNVGPRYDAADLEMTADFGRRLGGALEAARLAKEAREADRRKDEFLAMLGHELRNPLAPILTALQLQRLRKTAPDKEQQIIERQVRHMVRLVDDLLDISRITRGKVELKPESLRVADVLASAVEIARPLIEQGAHQLLVTIDPPEARVKGDSVRLAQIFANLLTNAAKYSPAGAQITVVAVVANGTLQTSVRDTGIGIPLELLPKVFDLFVQGERSLDRAQGGLGIGLTLVRSLAERHGGTVVAHSDGPGTGSEFVVRLPAEEAATPALPAVIPVDTGDAGSRVLVVDDNRDAAELLGETLKACGHLVKVAYDGAQALVLAATFRPDTAVLDIGLPLMDGYQLARRLRLLPGLAGLRLVALSGYGQQEDKARSMDAGFDVHLVKPADLDSILAAVAPPP